METLKLVGYRKKRYYPWKVAQLHWLNRLARTARYRDRALHLGKQNWMDPRSSLVIAPYVAE